jgi:hypothetical protein
VEVVVGVPLAVVVLLVGAVVLVAVLFQLLFL